MAGISAPASWAPHDTEDSGTLRNNVWISPKGMKVVIAASVGLALAAALGVLPGDFGASEASTVGGESEAHRVETVLEGDSLWAIATRAMPDREPWAAVRELRTLNGPAATKLHPGQVLQLP